MTASDQTPACFLCAGGGDDPARDPEHFILLRGTNVFAVLNLYPYNTGHTLVAPYRHAGDLGALDPAIAAEMMALSQRLVRALQAEYRPDGFNTGMNLGRIAGAGLPDHLHLHIVPRWGGDTSFMTVTADTKVMPETVAQTYERLRARLARGDGA